VDPDLERGRTGVCRTCFPNRDVRRKEDSRKSEGKKKFLGNTKEGVRSIKRWEADYKGKTRGEKSR